GSPHPCRPSKELFGGAQRRHIGSIVGGLLVDDDTRVKDGLVPEVIVLGSRPLSGVELVFGDYRFIVVICGNPGGGQVPDGITTLDVHIGDCSLGAWKQIVVGGGAHIAYSSLCRNRYWLPFHSVSSPTA